MENIALKWYNYFGFEGDFSDLETYDEGKRLIKYLCKCEEFQNKFEKKGISKEVFDATAKGLIPHVDSCVKTTGKLGVKDSSEEWLDLVFSFTLFHLGRLQFCMFPINYDVPEEGLKKGDNVIDVHIPRGESLTKKIVDTSFDMAKDFFKKYFPEFKFDYYTCHSWMLDDTLYKFLDKDSNIIRFKEMWQPRVKLKMDSILYFVFPNYGTRENLKNFNPTSSFAKKVKEYAISGGDFYNVLGVRKAED
ncbi:MAG: hypothetical protein J6V58_05505 [Clostridia bacterium]|nr:hypothetical protein [Clostridia bacterium]